MKVSPQLDREALQTAVHSALVNWNRMGPSDETPLTGLLLVQSQCAGDENANRSFAERQTVNKLLQDSLVELATHDEVGAKVLTQRFLEGKITRQVAGSLHASPDQVNRWQRTAIEGLSQIIYDQETACRQKQINYLTAALPIANPPLLVGCEKAIDLITSKLLEDEGPKVVAITGIGGIGKTSLADAVVRHIIPIFAFDEFVWLQASMSFQAGADEIPGLSSEQIMHSLAEKLGLRASGSETIEEQITRLRQILHDRSSLIVVDNLETEEQASALLTTIEPLIQPSKFLLTTRARPITSAAVYYASVAELSFNNASTLLEQHAKNVGIDALAAAGEEIYAEIFETTGGNPLALKLVVGLASALPLEQIIAGLKKSRPGPIESLYRHIYWEAWRTLSPEGQSLLQAMPLIGDEGGLPEHMQVISNLADEPFWAAVRELFTRSLIEVRGDIKERRYGIHRLTETFLRTEIIAWPIEQFNSE